MYELFALLTFTPFAHVDMLFDCAALLASVAMPVVAAEKTEKWFHFVGCT